MRHFQTSDNQLGFQTNTSTADAALYFQHLLDDLNRDADPDDEYIYVKADVLSAFDEIDIDSYKRFKNSLPIHSNLKSLLINLVCHQKIALRIGGFVSMMRSILQGII